MQKKLALKDCFVRGSVIRYVHLNKADVDTKFLQEQTRLASQHEKAN